MLRSFGNPKHTFSDFFNLRPASASAASRGMIRPKQAEVLLADEISIICLNSLKKNF
jgi:hypothetical protein